MNIDLINTCILAGAFLLLFTIGEFLYHFLHFKAEWTRKFVHFSTGLLTLLFPIMLQSHWYVLALCVTFALILLLSQRFNLLKSINAIDRASFGSISYPVAVYGCYLAYVPSGNYIFFYLPILVLAVSDPLAALVGRRFPLGRFKAGTENKTLMGSSVFFLSAFAVSLLVLSSSYTIAGPLLLLCISLALITAITEAFTRRGLDNISIPAVALIVLYSFSTYL